MLGWTDREIYLELNDAIVKQNTADALEAIGKVVKTGHDPTQFILGLLRFMRNLLLFKSIPNAKEVIEEPVDFLEKLKTGSESYTPQQLLYSVDVLLEVLPRLESTEAKQTIAMQRSCLNSFVFKSPPFQQKRPQKPRSFMLLSLCGLRSSLSYLCLGLLAPASVMPFIPKLFSLSIP